MKEIKFLASDIDGTLLFNFAKELDPEICVLLKRLMKEKGIRFFASSGRQYNNLRKLFDPIKDEIGYVCENGALSIIDGKVIHQEYMDRELGWEVIDAMNATGKGEAVVSGINGVYICPHTQGFADYLEKDVGYNVMVVPDLKEIEEPYMKISMFGFDENAREVAEIKEKFKGRCAVVTSGNDWLDVMPLGVDKGFALRKVFAHLGLDPKECMAIGDNANDKEMLEAVGYPVAVESGLQSIVDMAPYHAKDGKHLFQMLLDGTFVF